MATSAPPQFEAARTQVEAALSEIEKRKVDTLKDSWADIEKGVIKLLGGPLDPQKPDHQMVAIGLSAAFGARLSADHGAFWFPTRATPEGASLGFPEALIMLSPFGAVLDALAQAKLSKLDEVAKEIRASLGQVKFSGGQAMRLRPDDYIRLFDPGFVQVVGFDTAKAEQTWGLIPDRLSGDLRDAINKSQRLPAEVKKQLEQQLVGALQRLDPRTPVIQQIERAPRVAEMMSVIFAATHTTGSAPEEFWAEFVFPLLFIGAPTSFPPLDDDDLEPARQGADPLFLFMDQVPYTFKSPEEAGLLGAFDAKSMALPHPSFGNVGDLRLIKVGPAGIADAVKAFDAAKTKASVAEFTKLVRAKVPQGNAEQTAQAEAMFDAALTLIADLKTIIADGKDLCIRRLTEAEAASEPALALVRESAKAPRIILST